MRHSAWGHELIREKAPGTASGGLETSSLPPGAYWGRLLLPGPVGWQSRSLLS
jgi:hypothetical protein